MSVRPVALVTGAARGIGLAIAHKLAADGFDLFAADLNIEAAEGAAEVLRRHGGRAFALAGDLSDLDRHASWIERIRAETTCIDCLVNNAGMGSVSRGDLLDLRPENFDRVMDVNLRGTIFLTQAIVRLMLQETGDGRRRSIVNLTSISASHASPDRLDYCVSKAGLAMWSKGLALRLARENIAVFDVRPGIIRTGMTAAVSESYSRLIESGLVPAGRWGEAKDVADAVASLASGVFAFATGSVVGVDGGLSINRL